MTRKDCRDCPDRTMNCHSTCKTYLKLVERLDKIKAEREKIKHMMDI